MEELADKAKKVTAKGDLNTVYKITKQLSGQSNTHIKPIKDEEGKVITTEKEQAARWVEHFKEAPTRRQPNEAANRGPSDGLNINTDPPSRAEVDTVIKPLKNVNAPGIDSLQAGVLKADTITTSLGLNDFVTKI